MKSAVLVLMGLLLVWQTSTATAQIYECPTAGGGTEFTNEDRGGCHLVIAPEPEPPSGSPPTSAPGPSSGADTQASGGSPSSEQLRQMEQTMLSDPEIMSLIAGLRNDPEFLKMLQDPEVLKAVSTGDIAALKENPAFMKLLQNSTVKEIQQKVLEKNP